MKSILLTYNKKICLFLSIMAQIRLVLDIPLRIRTHHTFDIYSAFEKAIENKIDFRTFFEWYRNQEDYENECKLEKGDFYYEDRALKAVKQAILAMLDDCSNLRVARRPRIGNEN